MEPQHRTPSEAVALDATLTADVDAAAAEFTLAVTNTGSTPVTLQFPSSRVAEFVVVGDTVVWRSSNSQFVTQALWNEEVGPGETLTETATWARPISGSYTVEATLDAVDIDISVGAPLEISG